MMRVCKLLTILVILVGNDLTISVLSLLPPIQIPAHSSACSEKLGIKFGYAYDSPKLAYNQTCWTKCTYEEEGKLDANENFVLSKFPDNSSDAIEECLNIIKTTDICKKVTLLDNCVNRKTDPYWKKYEQCEEYVSYNDVDATTSPCYQRCQMIIFGSLDEDGKVNLTSFTGFEENPNNIITHEEALEKCKKIVTDEDDCTRDLNMYHCVNYMLYHWSSEVRENELQCAKENDVLPIFGVQNFNTSRTCYDRCLLIKSGDLDEHDLKNSEFFKSLNMSETQLEEAFNTCKMTLQETDGCSKDLYFYDCVSYLKYADPVYLKKQTECALETNATLVSHRGQYKENYCNTRCIMIKDGQLDYDASINTTSLRHISNNATIIEESVDECNEKNAKTTCVDDVNAYYCARSKIHEKVNMLCEIESKNNKAAEKGGYCYSRCLMVHGNQLTPEGEVVIDSFKQMAKNITSIEKAIKICKAKMIDGDECARVVNHYYCVTSQIWNLNMDYDNGVHASKIATK